MLEGVLKQLLAFIRAGRGMQYAHRPIDAKGTAQLLLVKVETVVGSDPDNALEAVLGKLCADGIFQC